MPLTILYRLPPIATRVTPTYFVRCTLCGDEYRVTAYPSQLLRTAGCSTCFHATRAFPGTVKERREAINARRRARDAADRDRVNAMRRESRQRKRIAKHLELRGFRLVKCGP